MTSPTPAATGQWTPSGALPSAAAWHGQHDGAVPLKNGRVLVVGGADGTSVARAQAALFDPAAGTWTATAALQTPRRLHTATLLDDGKVLVTGGTGGSSPLSPALASAELYDPVTGAWTPAASMGQARAGHSAVLLDNRKVLVAGGTTVRSGDSVRALASAELYDPATNTWSATASMADARAGHPAVLLKGGRVLVAGGFAPVSGTAEAALAFCELYDPAAATWTPTGTMTEPRGRHPATLVSDTTVLVTGGSAASDRLTAELYDLATGAWTALPDRPGGRILHRTVPFGPGRALVIGGTSDARDDAGYRGVLILDVAARTWSPAGGLATGRWAFAAAVLPDARVLVTGGITGSGLAAADTAADDLTASTEIFAAGGPA